MCDSLTACVRTLWFSTRPTVDVEANAEKMSGAFEAQVFAIEKELSTHSVKAKALVASARLLKDQKNPGAGKREAEAKVAVARVVALKKKRDKFEGLAAHFRKIKENFGEARQLRDTVGTLSMASRQLQGLKLDKIVESADDLASFSEDVDAKLSEISEALSGPHDPNSSADDMAALEAYLEFEQECAAADAPSTAQPPAQAFAAETPRLLSRTAYSEALLNGTAAAAGTRVPVAH